MHAFFQTYGPELHRRAQQQAGGTKTAEAARGPDRGEGGSEAAGYETSERESICAILGKALRPQPARGATFRGALVQLGF